MFFALATICNIRSTRILRTKSHPVSESHEGEECKRNIVPKVHIFKYQKNGPSGYPAGSRPQLPCYVYPASPKSSAPRLGLARAVFC